MSDYRRDRLQDHLAYPPRAMRADRAAAYLDMSRASFLRLVDDSVFPKATRITGGMVLWDRLELDAAFDAMKDRGNRQRSSGNTMYKILGIVHEDEHD
jgi:predicted DNA-binding transcriptional regulator AlpA